MIFAQNWCITRPTPASWVTPPWNVYMAKFAPAERVTRATRLRRSPHLSCKRDLIKLRDYMDRRVTAPKRVTSPTWDPSPPCKQALIAGILYDPCQFSQVCACLFQSQCFASPHYKIWLWGLKRCHFWWSWTGTTVNFCNPPPRGQTSAFVIVYAQRQLSPTRYQQHR